jgi:hypothetical protein
MGPAATTTAHRLFPAARLSDRGPPRPGRLTAPASPAGLRPALDPHGAAHPDRQQPGNRADHGPRLSSRPAGQSGMPSNARNTGKKPVKPRLTRPRSFRDDTEEVAWPISRPRPRSVSSRPKRRPPRPSSGPRPTRQSLRPKKRPRPRPRPRNEPHPQSPVPSVPAFRVSRLEFIIFTDRLGDLCKTLLLLPGGSLPGMCRKLVTRRIR